MKHLFIDDHEVERIDNLARKLHQPQKFHGNAVVRPEHLWENNSIQIRGAPAWVPDESLFKMIYGASAETSDPTAQPNRSGDLPGEAFVCYTTSPDGVNWEKPPLELYDYPGLLWTGKPVGGRNNILPSALGLWLAPIYDPHDPDPQRRYKGMGWPPGRSGLVPAVSPDCLHWKLLDVAIDPVSDEAQLNYDEGARRFILTCKRRGPYGRAVYLSTSEDFEHWSEPELIFHADQQDQENGAERIARFFNDPAYRRPTTNRPEEYRTDIYHMAAFPYEGLYLGLPVMFHWSGKHPPMYENTDGRKTIELTSSRDLRHWERVANRAPFLEQSPVGDGSAYDTGQLEPGSHPIVRNDELWFYYTGLKNRGQTPLDRMTAGHLDMGGVCLARLRLDGFVSLKGGVEPGSVLTRPFVIEGRELRVNVDSWRGQVRAEILDASDGRPLPGYTLDESVPAIIDRIDVPMRWKARSDLSDLRGRTVRLRFSLLRAELYAFWFGT